MARLKVTERLRHRRCMLKPRVAHDASALSASVDATNGSHEPFTDCPQSVAPVFCWFSNDRKENRTGYQNMRLSSDGAGNPMDLT